MRSEITRMICGRGFAAAVLVAVIAIAAGTSLPKTEGLLESGAFLGIFQAALCAKPVCYLLPVAAVLPWSDSFLAEWKGGFLKTVLPRTGRRGYVENKILTIAFGGFLVWAVAGLLVLFGYFLIFFPMEKSGVIEWERFREPAAILLRCGLISAMLASLGGICGVLGESGYFAFGFPFVGYYFCMVLQERYFPDALWLYPPQWISGKAQWGEHGEGLWLFLSLTLGIVVGVHGAVIFGKLEEI